MERKNNSGAVSFSQSESRWDYAEFGPYRKCYGTAGDIGEHRIVSNNIGPNRKSRTYNMKIIDEIFVSEIIGPYQTVSDNTEPYLTISGSTYRTIQVFCIKNWTTMNRIEQYRPYRTTSDHSGPYQTIFYCIGPFRTIPNSTGQYCSILQ